MTHQIVSACADNYPWAVCSCGRSWSYVNCPEPNRSIQVPSGRSELNWVFGSAQVHVAAESRALSEEK